MIIDLHCHSKYSRDNYLEPPLLIQRAIELGLDGVCFTEHHSIEVSRPVTKLETPPDFIVLRGVEVSTDWGHLLVYGVNDDSWNRWGRNNFLKLVKVAEIVHGMGGICIPAHPFRGWESIGEKVYEFNGFDALETYNGGNSPIQNRLAEEAAGKLGLPSIGGSDCHILERVGRCVTEFPNCIGNIHDLVREIKAGNCRALPMQGDYSEWH